MNLTNLENNREPCTYAATFTDRIETIRLEIIIIIYNIYILIVMFISYTISTGLQIDDFWSVKKQIPTQQFYSLHQRNNVRDQRYMV